MTDTGKVQGCTQRRTHQTLQLKSLSNQMNELCIFIKKHT